MARSLGLSTLWTGMDESSLTSAQRLVLVRYRDACDRLRPGPLGRTAFFNDHERDSYPS